VWSLAGEHAPTAGISAASPLVIDVDATLVEAHSAKEGAAPTFKGGFGYHPLTAWFDHGADGAGECAAIMLRPGNAGANTAADHIEVISRALDQAGLGSRPGRKVLVRIDGAGGTKETVGFLARRRVSYSVGFKLPDRTPDIYAKIPKSAWAPAYNADGDPRQGADVAEITGMLDLTGWPEGMRVIMRRERPHPGARLRFDDVGGYRLTALATNTGRGRLPGLEVRHRLRARCEDRIRCAKDTGLDRFPLQGFAPNRIWCQIVALAHDLLAWSQLLALTGHPARKWEPRTIRARLMHIPATIARHARRVVLRYRADHPWTRLLLQGIGRLQTLPAP
jgi:transposase DDE domain